MRARAAVVLSGLAMSPGLVACNLVSGVDEFSLVGGAGGGTGGTGGAGGSGGAGAAPGRTVWSRSYGGPSTDGVTSVAIRGEDEIVLAGFHGGDADFGDLVSDEVPGVFVARVSGAGETAGLATFGTGLPNLDMQPALALAGDGTTVLAGSFTGDVDFGAGVVSAPSPRLFVAQLDVAGVAGWVIGAGEDAVFGTPHVATDGAGSTFLFVDAKSGSVALGGTTYQNTDKNAAYLAKIDGAGAIEWSRSFANAEFVYALSVAVDRTGQGSVYAVGKADTGDLDCGCADGPLVMQPYGMFVARYGGDGQCLSQVSFGFNTPPHGATVDGEGNLIVVGAHSNGFDVQGTALGHTGGADFNFDVYVIKLDSTGQLVWARSFGAAGVHDDADEAVVVSGGDVLVTGHVGGPADLGDGVTLEGETSSDLYVVRFRGSDGVALWGRRFSNLTQFPVLYSQIAASPGGDVLVGGQFAGAIDFGDGDSPHAAAGGLDGYLVRLAGE